MIAAPLLLSLAYVITTALLLLMNLATPYSSRIKGLAIVMVSGLYVASWFGYQGYDWLALIAADAADFRSFVDNH